MTPKELAAAIRMGAAMVSETKSHCGCALGAAYMAITGKNLVLDGPFPPSGEWDWKAADALGISRGFATEISRKHFSGASRLDIADWLDTLEPETRPADKQSFDAFMVTVMKPVPVTA